VLCAPLVLVGLAAVTDAIGDRWWARTILVGLVGMLLGVAVIGIATIGPLLAPSTGLGVGRQSWP
jgi:hypothetical protein